MKKFSILMVSAIASAMQLAAAAEYANGGGPGAVANGGAVAIPVEWQKARTLKGVYEKECWGAVSGFAQVKCGKANKNGIAKVSLTITPFSGRKITYNAVSVDVTKTTDGGVEVLWPRRSGAFPYRVLVHGNSFYGGAITKFACEVDVVRSAQVGGGLQNGRKWFSLYVDEMPSLGAGWYVMDYLLPYEVALTVTGGKKLDAGKVPSVKLARFREDGETWYELSGIYDEAKPNVSGLKISYTPNTGMFKGSFKVYAVNEEGATPKLKKFTVNVTGVVVDGVGFGQAVMKNPAGGPWSVVFE